MLEMHGLCQLALSAQRPGRNAQVGRNYPRKCQLQVLDYLQCSEQKEGKNKLLGSREPNLCLFYTDTVKKTNASEDFVSCLPYSSGSQTRETAGCELPKRATHDRGKKTQQVSPGASSGTRAPLCGRPPSGPRGAGGHPSIATHCRRRGIAVHCRQKPSTAVKQYKC